MSEPGRRVSLRLACDVPLIVSLDTESKRPTRNLVGRVSNISEGGVLLLLPERLPRGARLTLIHLPPEDMPAMRASSVESRVAWSAETPNAAQQFQHGVQFLSPASHLVTTLLALKA